MPSPSVRPSVNVAKTYSESGGGLGGGGGGWATSAGVAVTIAGDSSPAAMLSGLRPSSLEAARDVAYISSSLSAPLLTAVADVQQLHQSL